MTDFDASQDLVDSQGKATSYLEEIIYQLDHIPEGSPTSSAAGEKGQMFRDSTYIYICYDTDTWGRISFTTGY